MGLSVTETEAAAAATGTLLKSMGFTAAQTADMTNKTMKMAEILSLYSGGVVKADDVSNALAQAEMGRTVSLKRLGIAISANDLKEQMLKDHTDKLTGKQLLQGKAMAVMELVYARTGAQQKAFDSGQNKMLLNTNKLKAAVKNLWDGLVTQLAPGLTNVAGKMAAWTTGHMPEIKKVVGEIGTAISTLATIAGPALKLIARSVELIFLGFGKLLGIIEKTIGALDKYNAAGNPNKGATNKALSDAEANLYSTKSWMGGVMEGGAARKAAQQNYPKVTQIQAAVKIDPAAIASIQQAASAVNDLNAAERNVKALTAAKILSPAQGKAVLATLNSLEKGANAKFTKLAGDAGASGKKGSSALSGAMNSTKFKDLHAPRITGAAGSAEDARRKMQNVFNTPIQAMINASIRLPSSLNIPIPHLASGGLVKARPGGVLALLAEGGRDEVVSPVGAGSGAGADITSQTPQIVVDMRGSQFGYDPGEVSDAVHKGALSAARQMSRR
jgi:hypothetical protein